MEQLMASKCETLPRSNCTSLAARGVVVSIRAKQDRGR